jgi:Protein of unknown function (DUF3489)
MKTFFLNGNKIAVCESRDRRSRFRQGAEKFGSERELFTLAAKWPASRLHEIWNALPGTQPIRKFTDRKTAVRRIWNEIQKLKRCPSSLTRPGTKADKILALLQQPRGATLQTIMKATGWQVHSVRGFISGYLVKKMRLRVESFRRDGERVYRTKG